ncbi:hypothetical protein CTAYLR_006160 [Chrysophaeum taylorii]|uniref:protein-tyrosine-phosphatase n=1 Tax=Chrysophaeum taylorii TaxID=2483200 RepID=A0AAD7UQ09_9STRA|nr:hypothetical protein CTAYLR_006160 [Chrysophaeum taylorii]
MRMSFERTPYSSVILRNRLVFTAVNEVPRPLPPNSHWFSIDDKLVYWNFFLDFGPLNLGHLYRFCAMLNAKLHEFQGKAIFFYSSTHPHQRTNGAFLIGAWQMLYLGRTAEEAFSTVECFDLEPFHDATPGKCNFHLDVLDCLRGLGKARFYGFFEFDTFDIAEYEYFEAVENGDLNWIVKDKIFAFAGPHDADARQKDHGYRTLPPEHFVPYFVRKGVTLVVRLNKPYYKASTFTAMGADFADLYYLDGSNPPLHILKKFILIAERTPGAFGVHCKAGLGRTGTCIGSYLMKHFKFTAEEIIGWMRICRPGCVIGQQQHFLKEIEQALWREGDAYRAARGEPLVSPDITTHRLHHSPSKASSPSRVIPFNSRTQAAYQTLAAKLLDLGLDASVVQGSSSSSSSQGDELRRRRQAGAY